MYVIRSMSTTDATPSNNPTPYHIYLLKPEKRVGAYWARHQIDAATFDTIDAAMAHGDLALTDKRFDVVPRRDSDVPTYWDARAGNSRARVIGNAIEH